MLLSGSSRIVPTTYVPFIRVAQEGSRATFMIKGPHNWVSNRLVRYSPIANEARASIPALMKNEVLPCAEEISELLAAERKMLWD